MARNSNQKLVPQAREALDKLKYEVANQIGIQTPADGYWGDFPAKATGQIGGNMVRQMIQAAEQSLINQTISNVRAGFQQGLQAGATNMASAGKASFTGQDLSQNINQNPNM